MGHSEEALLEDEFFIFCFFKNGESLLVVLHLLHVEYLEGECMILQVLRIYVEQAISVEITGAF